MTSDQIIVEVLASSAVGDGVAVIGNVVETGEHATQLAGKRVLVGPLDPCGECDVCRRGGAAVCPTAVRRSIAGDDHTHQPRVTAAARWAVPLDFELPLPGAAAVAGDLALAYTLYARTGPAPREPVIVAGGTAVARFLVEILLAKSVAPVVLADPAARYDWLRDRAPLATTRDEVTTAISAQGVAGRTWRVIAAAGDADTIARAVGLAGPRSTLTVLAPVATLPAELAAREVTIIPVAGAHPDLIVEVAAMCAKGELDLVAGTTTAENADMRAIVRPR